jgi:hypothetical protein
MLRKSYRIDLGATIVEKSGRSSQGFQFRQMEKRLLNAPTQWGAVVERLLGKLCQQNDR